MKILIKKILSKDSKLYFQLSLINKVGISLVLINFIFQRILRRNSKLGIGIHFTSTICKNNLKFSKDMNTLSSFAISGNCYFQTINGIKLGKNCLFAPGVKLISANHDSKNHAQSVIAKPLIIGDNVWIGTNVVILPEVEIGNNCVIGAGSIVTKSFKEDNLIIAGNPAKVLKRV